MFNYLEVLAQSATLFIGIKIVIKDKNNRLNLYWGLLYTAISLFSLNGTIRNLLNLEPILSNISVLNPQIMLWWFTYSLLFAFYPPAFLKLSSTRKKHICHTLMIPYIVASTLFFSLTLLRKLFLPLSAWSEYNANYLNPDVQIRMLIYLLTCIPALLAAVNSYLCVKIKPQKHPFPYNLQQCRGYFLLSFMLYSVVVWIPSETLKSIFYIWAFLILLDLSKELIHKKIDLNSLVLVKMMRGKYQNNELSAAKNAGKENAKDDIEITSKLFSQINEWIQSNKLYTNPNFNEGLIVKRFDIPRTIVARAMKQSQYSSFREYITRLRIDHFKKCAEKNPFIPLKMLIAEAGFISRATFYRNFEAIEERSPGDYIEKLREEAYTPTESGREM